MDRLLIFFNYDHLPPKLQEVSKPFHDIAHHLIDVIPSNAELTVALRKLLEAKDCAVRAVVYNDLSNASRTAIVENAAPQFVNKDLQILNK